MIAKSPHPFRFRVTSLSSLTVTTYHEVPTVPSVILTLLRHGNYYTVHWTGRREATESWPHNLSSLLAYWNGVGQEYWWMLGNEVGWSLLLSAGQERARCLWNQRSAWGWSSRVWCGKTMCCFSTLTDPDLSPPGWPFPFTGEPQQ